MKLKQRTLLTVLMTVVAVCFFALVIFPNFVRTGGVDPAAWCRKNLREIDAAIEQWALEHQKPNGTPVTSDDISPYLPHGKMPECPIGGHYIFIFVGDVPRCSMPTNEHKITH